MAAKRNINWWNVGIALLITFGVVVSIVDSCSNEEEKERYYPSKEDVDRAVEIAKRFANPKYREAYSFIEEHPDETIDLIYDLQMEIDDLQEETSWLLKELRKRTTKEEFDSVYKGYYHIDFVDYDSLFSQPTSTAQ